MDNNECIILRYLSGAINNTNDIYISEQIDWHKVDRIAKKHAILPLLLQVTSSMPIEQKPHEDYLRAWKCFTIGTVMRNECSMRAQNEVVSLLKTNNVPCVIIKGTSIAYLYPRPELRTLGDIDILIRRDQCAEAISVLEGNGYRKHEMEHKFHIGFDKAGIYVELHYMLSEYPNSRIGNKIKHRLENAVDRAKTATIEEYTFPVLEEPDQALSLLLHMERHMVGGGIGLRQLCDWCVFIGSLSQDCLQNVVHPIIRKCQLFQFASILTRICVDYLGLDESKHQWCMHIPKRTADELLADILDSGNIMSRDLERAASSTFVKGEESADGKQSMLSSATKNLTQSAKKQFPICNKLPVLLPVFWVYIPARYLYRSLKGTRPKLSVSKIAKYAMKRKRLYRKLELFKK